jgi:hypothetical protein
MNSSSQLVGVLHFWALMTLAWVFYYVCWKGYRRDAFRDELFALRHRLFLLACDEEGLNFDRPAYVQERHLLNGLIRFAEQMTPLRALLATLFVPAIMDNQPDWDDLLRELPSDIQAALRDIRECAHKATVNYVVFGSPVMMMFLVVSRVSDHLMSFFKRVRDAIGRSLEIQAQDDLPRLNYNRPRRRAMPA